MSKNFKTLSSLIASSSLRSLLNEAQHHQEALEIIRATLGKTSAPINQEDLLSCAVTATEIILSCDNASKATLIQQTSLMALPELKQQFPEIFPPSIKKITTRLATRHT